MGETTAYIALAGAFWVGIALVLAYHRQLSAALFWLALGGILVWLIASATGYEPPDRAACWHLVLVGDGAILCIIGGVEIVKQRRA